jgi:E3 ubiquitin-protein ligase RGLG
MGCCASGGYSTIGTSTGSFSPFADKYETIEEVQEALRRAGLESSNLILGIDYTKSNDYNGRRTFGGRPLHHISSDGLNPYQQAISIIGRTLEPFDDDKLIPVFGFGDITTKDKGVFSFYPDNRPCNGFGEVLHRYTEITPHVQLSGPTSFAPIINEAIRIVKHSREYHILVIVADGQVTSARETVAAIVEASKYPLSIIVVGVGDGPWEMMEEFDDGLPQRTFDNFQFVNYHTVTRGSYPEASFALAALMEIPDQYKAIRRLGLL